MNTNVKGWLQMLILVGFKLKDGYECYDGLWIWYMMNTNVKRWIQMLILVGFKLKNGVNIMMDLEFNTGWIWMLKNGLWIWYMLDSIVDPVCIQMLRMDTNIRVGLKCGYKMDTNAEDKFKNWIPVGFDCWSNLNTNV